jgi:hypothetical protein
MSYIHVLFYFESAGGLSYYFICCNNSLFTMNFGIFEHVAMYQSLLNESWCPH